MNKSTTIRTELFEGDIEFGINAIMYFNHADSVSISKRLGHAQVSTTENIYAHIIDEADKSNADILESVFLKKA